MVVVVAREAGPMTPGPPATEGPLAVELVVLLVAAIVEVIVEVIVVGMHECSLVESDSLSDALTIYR